MRLAVSSGRWRWLELARQGQRPRHLDHLDRLWRLALQDGGLGGLLVVIADLWRLERRAAGERGGHQKEEPQFLGFHQPSSFDQLMAGSGENPELGRPARR
jgi:hypothetical protein